MMASSRTLLNTRNRSYSRRAQSPAMCKKCEICLENKSKFFVSKVCIHKKMCTDCAKSYFTVQIDGTDSGLGFICSMCIISDERSHIQMVQKHLKDYEYDLKNLVSAQTFLVYKQKMVGYELINKPQIHGHSFSCCPRCHHGFIDTNNTSSKNCTKCNYVYCSKCLQKWTDDHFRKTCEKYATILTDKNTYMNVVQCPQCKHGYVRSGGCLHMTCSYCCYEFCSDCKKQFVRTKNYCIKNCVITGLHAHHPRHCQFFTRDKDIHELQTLLSKNNFTYLTTTTLNVCSYLVDDSKLEKCKSATINGYSNYCDVHYKQYLLDLISREKLDPLPIFDVKDCMQELRRHKIPLPERGPWDTDELYADICKQTIKTVVYQ